MASQNFVTRPGSQFFQSGTGAVERTVSDKLKDVVSVKDFGAVGDGITDDTAALQAAINEAMIYGKQLLFQGPGPYCISSTLTVKVKRDLAPPSTPPSSNIHFSDNTAAFLVGLGTPTIKATAAMASMMELIFDTSDSDIGPFYSEVIGIGFDGNNVAVSGLKSNFTMHVVVRRCRFWNLTRGVEYTGYGVATIYENTFKCVHGIYLNAGGGDSSIFANDFYSKENVAGSCVLLGYYSGNSRIYSNVFTNEDGLSYVRYGIQFQGSLAPASEEIRDIVIRDNEFSGMTEAIRIDGKASGNKNVYRVIITGNHTLPFGSNNTGYLVAAVDCKQLEINNNFCNATSLPGASSAGIELVRTQNTKIQNNSFANYSGAAISLSDCEDTLVDYNTFTNCGTAGTSFVVIPLFGGSSARNYFRHNIFRQTTSVYGQYGIVENAGVNRTFSHDNSFDGFERPHTKVGPNSVMRLTQYASGVPTTGSYYQGDIVWNTLPVASGTPGWICTTAGVNSFVFKAMANLAP